MSRKTLDTSCGMWGIWDYSTYNSIESYEDWENVFCEDEDISKQIMQHTFVPIYIHSDGCFDFQVKVNSDLDERERQYLLARSKPYLLLTQGEIRISGIDHIEKDVEEDYYISLNVEPGKYVVNICLIEWDKEPDMILNDGTPSSHALPDFIVLIASDSDDFKEYNQSIETFDD